VPLPRPGVLFFAHCKEQFNTRCSCACGALRPSYTLPSSSSSSLQRGKKYFKAWSAWRFYLSPPQSYSPARQSDVLGGFGRVNSPLIDYTIFIADKCSSGPYCSTPGEKLSSCNKQRFTAPEATIPPSHVAAHRGPTSFANTKPPRVYLTSSVVDNARAAAPQRFSVPLRRQQRGASAFSAVTSTYEGGWVIRR
jgi:hypothetical protein